MKYNIEIKYINLIRVMYLHLFSSNYYKIIMFYVMFDFYNEKFYFYD